MSQLESPDGTPTDVTSKVGFRVGERFRALVQSLSRKVQEIVNAARAEAYSLYSAVTAAGAGDCILYIKNLSNDDLHLTAMDVYAASAESFQVKVGDIGNPATDNNTLTPRAMNGRGKDAAEATIEDGTDITGLSGGEIRTVIWGGATGKKYIWDEHIIIPRDDVLTVYAVAGGIVTQLTPYIHFQTPGV